ncbi:hypothetical protein TNCV_214381 [Trichonephila clavipes]|nr:hypothetical protein TNCV_214381 [Trichonephila clavipes]
MAAVDSLHHESPATWAGVESATLGTEVQRQINQATQLARTVYNPKTKDTFLICVISESGDFLQLIRKKLSTGMLFRELKGRLEVLISKGRSPGYNNNARQKFSLGERFDDLAD